MRVALYLRQSQDRTGQALGIERQRDDCMRLIDARGWEVVAEFVDNDVSATKSKPRPQFTEMMSRVDAGEFDAIVSRHMDRLLRKLSDFVSVRDRCQATDTAIVTAADGVDTSTDGGRLVAGILAMVAEGEMERKSNRQRSAEAQAARQGRRSGGPRPFGYENDGVTIREDEAALIKQAYADVLAGESLTYISRRWNEICTTTRGNRWRPTAVRQVLTNPRNAGLRRHRPQGAYSTDPRVGIVGPAQWPAIVDVPTWNATIQILCHPSRSKVRVPAEPKLLSGLVSCSVCGDGITGHGRTRYGYHFYRCRSGAHIAVKAEPVERYITEVVLERLTQPDAALLWSAERPDASKLMSEANALRAELDAIDQDRAEGRLDRVRWRTMNDRVVARLAEVEDAIARIGKTSPLSIVSSKDVRATWAGLSVNKQRSIIAALMAPVLHPYGRGKKFTPAYLDLNWKKINSV